MSILCGKLKIPRIDKSVRSGFLLTNCRIMVNTKLFRLIQPIRQCKSSRKNNAKYSMVAYSSVSSQNEYREAELLTDDMLPEIKVS